MGQGAAGLAFRTISYTLALLFAFAAAVQVNDPDPARWIAIYAVAGAVSLIAGRGGLLRAAVPGAVAAVSMLWALAIIGGGPPARDYARMFDAWEMRSIPVEQAREAAGLLLVAGWMVVVTFEVRRSRRAAARHGS